MVDRKSKYNSARDRASSVGGDTSRINQENFVTEFLKCAEEFNVYPLPKIICSHTDTQVPSEKMEEDAPVTFHFTYQNKKLMSPVKIETKVSICILDVLNFTMQKYNTVTVLKLQNCNLNAFGIMQIAEMLVNIGCIEDLNLDMNPNVQENYHLLCTPAGSLKYLSLKLCEITDEGVMKIASELRYRNPPNDPKLIILNLANNHITKDGADHIGKMLRTNRSLRCLVLLGNRVCDEGASSILRELKITTLEHEEIVKVRRKKFLELALLDEWIEQKGSEEIDRTINEEPLKRNAKSRTRQTLAKRSKKFLQETSIKPRVDESFIQGIQANESMEKIRMILGHENSYPFRTESFPMNGEMMATGNLELQYLDLSYNYLTTSILQELITCLYYQNYMLLGDTSRGLLFILIEGGYIRDEKNKDWITFESLLRQRQSGERLSNNAFREFVSEETIILRQSAISLTQAQVS